MQTVLRDPSLFKPAPHKCQGRTIYEHTETGSYWYVDNLHFGEASHLEVFNFVNDKHVGEADLKGEINHENADAKKKIRKFIK